MRFDIYRSIIPVYLKGSDGESDGIGRRQCTDNYKIRPIRRRIREMLGLRPRQRVPAGTTIELWLGISTDEAIRMKTSRDPLDDEPLPAHREGHVPQRLHELVEGALRQASGTLGLRRLPLPVPPAVGGDQAQMAGDVRRGGGDRRQIAGRAGALDKTPYLHSLRVPLAEAVALDEVGLRDDGQRDGFGNECEGHCGV